MFNLQVTGSNMASDTQRKLKLLKLDSALRQNNVTSPSRTRSNATAPELKPPEPAKRAES
jgi:hypothetical protein